LRELFSYQQKTVDWLCQTVTPRYVAHEPGLGKSFTSIAYADRVAAQRILVVGPAHGRLNWRREFEISQKIPRELIVVRKSTQKVIAPEACVVFMSYDMLSSSSSSVRPHLLNIQWDLLILDEAHMLGRDSERTRYVLNPTNGLYLRAKKTLPLSGTPATKSASELYPLFRALWPNLVRGKSWRMFEDEYCRVDTMKVKYGSRRDKTREVRAIRGTKPEKLPELRKVLTPIMDILKTDDVLTEIPPLRTDTHTLLRELFTNRYGQASNVLNNLDQKFAALFSKGGDLLQNLSSAELAFATERRAIGIAKAPYIVDIVKNELEADPSKKIVLFAIHRDVIEILHKGLDTFGVVRVDGGIGTNAKHHAQETFQTDPTVRVFIGQIQAASTNLTLTAAHDVIMCEASWSPGDNYQAIRRCRRIGQTKPVLARFITMDGADDKITRVLADRSRELDTLFSTGGDDETN
jgi:SNF2 family DNA or RNA helicase